MNEVEQTIQSYEDLAQDFSERNSDADDVNHIAPFFVKNLKGKKVLDIGCGPGRDAKYFYEHGLDVTGIDLASSFVKIASKNVPEAEFIKMDMRKLDFPENTFDGIWACACLIHIPKNEAKQTIIGFKRVLKPGGLMHVSVKQGDGKIKKDGRFYYLYQEDELKKLFEDFTILKLERAHKKDLWLNIFVTK